MRHVAIIALALSMLGCRANMGSHQPSATGGLSATEYAKLMAINDAQNSALTHVRKVAASRARRCRVQDVVGASAAAGGWSSKQKVDGVVDDCPVKYSSEWTFDGEQTLEFRHELSVSEQAPLTERKAHGTLKSVGGPGMREITGQIDYQPMNIAGVGRVDVRLRTAQVYTRKAGRGEVRVRVGQDAWSHEGVTRFRNGTSPKTVYEVDGRSITPQGFEALFSSYGVPEIMANSAKMR